MSTNIFDLIKNQISILDVVQEYTTLKKVGSSYWKGCCPFHHEKTASFTVSPHKEIFYCFGCHVHGDVIGFIARIEQCSQLEAARHLADRFKIELPKEEGLAQIYSHEKDHYHNACSVFAQWSHEQLLKYQHVVDYLAQRGVHSETIRAYMIGYVPAGISDVKSLVTYAKQKGILSKDLLDAHIILQGQSAPYCAFDDRIIFPIKDHLARICGFGGRVFKQHDTRSKYYNTREHAFFAKGSLLFGFDRAKSAIQTSETVFMVEGYMDCIAMVQAGFLNTVATLGTACTPNHLKQLSRYAHTIYIMYDSDRAGHDAVLRLTTLCWQVNMELKIVSLPAGHDPASFLLSRGNIQDLVQQAKDLFVFYINDIGVSFATKPLAKKLEGIKGLVEAIAAIEDTLKRNILLQDASQKLGIMFEILQKEVDRLSKKTPELSDIPLVNPVSQDSSLHVLEKSLICAILNNTDVLCEQNVHYLGTYLSKPLSDIVRGLFAIKKEDSDYCFRTFFALLPQGQQQYISNLTLSHGELDKEQFYILYRQWQRRQWKTIVTDMRSKIAQAHDEGNEHAATLLVEEFTQLKKDMLPVGEN